MWQRLHGVLRQALHFIAWVPGQSSQGSQSAVGLSQTHVPSDTTGVHKNIII